VGPAHDEASLQGGLAGVRLSDAHEAAQAW
jgi:hypothetical protein